MGYIYKISTPCSNKVYIGKTEQTIEDRFLGHIRATNNGSSYHIHNAMRKYGIENFKIEQIEECSVDILSERESYWIDYYDSFNNGYNMTKGGDGNTLYDYKEIADKYLELENEAETADFFGCSKGTVQSACKAYDITIKRNVQQKGFWDTEQGQKRKEKLRKQFIKNNPNKNGLSKEHKQKLSEAKKGKYCGKNSPNYGKHPSEETKQKMIKNSAMAKKVLCVETGEIYSSALQAAKAVGLKSSSGISKCCIGERKTAGKYHWQYV